MSKRDSNLRWWLCAVVVLALLLRLPHLAGSFWLDEAAQALESARPLSQQLDIIPDFQPPLYHFVVHFLLYISHGEAWLRFGASVVPALITVALVFDMARRWWGRTPALVAVGLLASNSLHVFFSQELRPYSLPAMWAVLGWWLITRLAKAPSAQWWLRFTLVAVLGIFTTYLYPFVLAVQYGYVLWRWPQRWRGLLVSGAMVAGSFALWLPIFLQQLAAGGEVRVQLPGWSQVVSTPQLKALPMVAIKFVFGVVNVEPNLWFAGAAALLAILFGWLVLGQVGSVSAALKPAQHKKSLQSPVVLVLAWLVLPVLAAWIVSLWIPVLQPKRVLYTLPAWCLLVSYLTTVIPAQRWLQRAALGTLLLIQLVGLGAYYLTPSLQRENWRALHTQLTQRYPAADTVIVFAFPEPYAPWRWYDGSAYPTLSTGTLAVDQVADLTQTLKPLTKYRYVVVFDYLRDLSDPNDELTKTITAFGYQPVELIDYPQIGFTRVYARAPEVISEQTRN